MSLLQEIKNKLASTAKNSLRKLTSLPDTAPGYVIRDDYWFGVAVPYEGELVSERFANARIRSADLTVEGKASGFLILECCVEEVRNQFATLCTEFLAPGNNNAQRHALVADPHLWWKKWRELLGNSIQVKKPYQILGELVTLEYLINSGLNPEWQGPAGNTKDIDTDLFGCEVKSTVNRYTTEIEISSKYQLVSVGKPLKLAFVRFEPANSGDTISTVFNRLCRLGVDPQRLSESLVRLGVEPGSLAYKEPYNLLELRFYDVDENFPVISDKSFVGGHMPANVVHFTYTLDLAGIPIAESFIA